MTKVAILGPGLLGGSIALAVRERAPEVAVAIWARRPEAATEAREGGFAHVASTDLAEVVRGADLVVLCTPVGSMGALALQMAPLLSPEALVTDVGSVKSSVVHELGTILGERFVGSHPMAGSEKTGMRAARADLFESTVCIVTPSPLTPSPTLARLSAFWQLLGCRLCVLSPREHDERVAMISHFPHLLAASLTAMVAERAPAAFELCGPGFRDTTRVASGAPGMWSEILCTNREAVRNSAEAMIEKLHELITLLDSPYPDQAMHEFLTQAKAQRDRLRLPR